MNVSVENRKVSNQTKIGKRWKTFGNDEIADEMNGFGLDIVMKTESSFWSTTPDVGTEF